MTKPDIFEISPVDFEFGNVVTHGTKEVVSKLRNFRGLVSFMGNPGPLSGKK